MDFLCSKRIYGWVRTRSHTEKKNKKKKTRKRHARGSVKRKWVCCGGINGHYSLPRCIRFTSHWVLKEPRLWLTSWSQTATKQHALHYLKMSCCFVFCFFVSSHTTPWLITSHFLVIHLTIAAGKSYCCQFGFVNVRSQCWFPKRSSILKICALVALWNTSTKTVHQRVNGTFHCFL